MKLDDIVPWGRTLEEYRSMFRLTEEDLRGKILGCGDGPASFNAEVTRKGGKVLSVDPLYRFDAEQIRMRIEQVYPLIISQVRENSEDYVWETIRNPEELGRTRMNAMQMFLSDYEQGRQEGRYLCASLPGLPFTDKSFSLALSSHFLFLYSAHLDEERHIENMRELCRVADEIRVYPLQSLDGKTSSHLAPVMTALSLDGMDVSLQPVPYQFRRGATEMLVVRARKDGEVVAG